MFVKMVKSRKREWLFISLISLIIMLFSIFLQFLMSLDTDKYVDMSTAFFIGVACFVLLFISFGSGIARLFNVHIGMGGTRKSFIISTWAISVIKYGVIFFLGFIMHKIQEAVLQGKQFVDINIFFELDICIILIIIIASMEIVMGSLVLRFGVKCYWILWGIYMIMCMLPARIEKAMRSKGDSILKSFGVWIIDTILNITRVQILGIGVVVAAVFVGISTYIIMTQDVTA